MVTIDPVHTYMSDRSALVRWSSDLPDPTFYVWVDGELRYSTKHGSGEFIMARGAPLIIDVFDDANARPRFARGATARLLFDDVGADAYLIERDDGTGYVVAQYADAVEAQHILRTGGLESGGETFRVTPIINNEPQTPVEVTADPVRLPYPPEVTMTFDEGTNQVTIAAA